MINPFKEINWNPVREERRKFARSLVLGFPCVAVLLLLAGRMHGGAWSFRTPVIIGGTGMGLGLVLLALPDLAKPFYVVWYFLGACIGIVVGNVLLAAAFYVFITVIGLLKRLFGRQAIRKTVDKAAATYWVDASQPDDPKRYYSQY